jgi:hypothetical protein
MRGPINNNNNKSARQASFLCATGVRKYRWESVMLLMPIYDAYVLMYFLHTYVCQACRLNAGRADGMPGVPTGMPIGTTYAGYAGSA